jgi:hypothetical protein
MKKKSKDENIPDAQAFALIDQQYPGRPDHERYLLAQAKMLIRKYQAEVLAGGVYVADPNAKSPRSKPSRKRGSR